MTDERVSSPEWESDASGLLTGLSQRIHRRRLLSVAAKSMAVTSCLAAIAFGGWIAQMKWIEADSLRFGLTCSDVRELMSTYLSDRLDAQRSAQLEKHVRNCPRCAEFRQQLRSPIG